MMHHALHVLDAPGYYEACYDACLVVTYNAELVMVNN